MTRAELDAAQAPLLAEACAVNIRYDFAHTGRSAEDVARSRELWSAMDALNDAYNAANPMPPCPECGSPRYATIGSRCLNFGPCSLAPPLGG